MPQNKKIKCLVVDDEPPAREILKQHIAGVDALELAGTCANAVEAISFLKDHPIDLIFLDIQMPQLLGTNFIRTLKSPPKVIFTTAFRKYALEGFELDAVDYLLKPISFERFLKGINKVMQINFPADHFSSLPKENHKEQANSFLYFRADRKMVKVFFIVIAGLYPYFHHFLLGRCSFFGQVFYQQIIHYIVCIVFQMQCFRY